jgi:hypothetical protein
VVGETDGGIKVPPERTEEDTELGAAGVKSVEREVGLVVGAGWGIGLRVVPVSGGLPGAVLPWRIFLRTAVASWGLVVEEELLRSV